MEPLAPVEPLIAPRHVAMAVGTGIATALMPVHRWDARTQRRITLGVAAATGIATTAVLLLGKPETVEQPADPTSEEAPRADEVAAMSPRAKVAIGAGAAVLVGVASVAGTALDGWAERSLAKRGVPRPRIWLGIAAGALSLAIDLADRSVQRKSNHHPAT